MSQKVKVQSLNPNRGRQINTIEGIKTFDNEGCILVSVNTALQMVDDVVWKLGKGYKLPKKAEEVEEEVEEMEEELEEDDEEESDEEDDEEEESDEEVMMNDEEIGALLKKIPSMKKKETEEVAEDLGIDPSIYSLPKLKAKIIKTLKGK